MTNVAAALTLAQKGFHVFPLKPGEKAPPLIKNFPKHASADPARITEWWAKWPGANIGIHCVGLVVIDVDIRSGGPKSLQLLEITEGLDPTFTTITPTGGKHLFYRLPEGHLGVGNSAGKLGPGLDIKTTGGYVLAPGSRVPAGAYRFEAGVPIAPAPPWLLSRLGVRSAPQEPAQEVPDAPRETLDRAREWLSAQPAGEGAYATACGLRDRGLSAPQAIELMAVHDPRPHVPDKVRHAYQYATGVAGGKVALVSDFEIVPAEPKKPHRGPQRLLELAQAADAGPGYLVKGLLQRGAHAVAYGPPGAGKTFVALDLAYHVAAGLPWMERKTHQGLVLYLAYEGLGGLRKRAIALVQHYGRADVPLYVHSADFNLREKRGREALGAVLAGLPEKPILVVVDTLARAMCGGDENSAQDMGALNDGVTALIEATGAAVLLTHHSGKGRVNGARGSSALLGAVDTELEINCREVRPTKQRDIELGDPIGFELTPIQIGFDEDNEPAMSCVVTARELTPGMDLGPYTSAWTALHDLGVLIRPVSYKAWRDAIGDRHRGWVDRATKRLAKNGVIFDKATDRISYEGEEDP